MLTVILLSTLVGVSLGLLGGGGSILAVPVLFMRPGWVPRWPLPLLFWWSARPPSSPLLLMLGAA